MGKKGGSQPVADVKGAAEVEGEFSRETARDVTYADRPTQYNPFGDVQWSQAEFIDPASGEKVTKWTQNQNLNAQSQGILDSQMGVVGRRSSLANSLMGRVNTEMGSAPDFDQFGQAQALEFDPTALRERAENAAYQKDVSRLDPRFQREREATDIRLRNQGLSPGDQAYDAQIESFNNQKNDAYERARLGSVETGRQESAQLYNQQLGSAEFANALRTGNIEEYLGKRGFSLGEVEAITQGQTLNETVSTFGGGGTA